MNNDLKKHNINNDDFDSLSPEELLEKYNLVRKNGMYFPQKIPAEKRRKVTEEEKQATQKTIHDMEVRKATMDLIWDAQARWEHAGPIIKRIKNIQLKLDNFFEDLGHQGAVSDSRSAVDFLRECFAGLNAQVSLLHHAYTDPTYYSSPKSKLYGDHRYEAQEDIFFSPDVNIVLENDGEQDLILVQMPQLFSMYANYQKAEEGFQFPSSWLPQFRHELYYKLSKMYPDLPHSKRYHLAFVHVYNFNFAHMVDNDNRDIKGVIDDIAQVLTMSDRATAISFSACTIVDKTIKEGSYICISTDYGNPVRLEKVQALLKANFCVLSGEN